MIHKKYVLLSVVMLMTIPLAVADDTNGSASFETITGGIFSDVESFLMALAIAIVSIVALMCIIWMIVGWFSHNQDMFMKGAKGCFIIIAAAVVYFIAMNGFEYIKDKYW